jgi:ParB family chromosome partitioning protein
MKEKVTGIEKIIVRHENTKTTKNNNIETIESEQNEETEQSGWTPCADCETRSKLNDCKNGCEIIRINLERSLRSEPVFKLMDIDCLHPDPSQPRKTFNEEKLKGLAETLKTQGMLQPIVADESGRIVIGERRWRAAKLAGLDKVPVVIRPNTDEERLIRQAIADAQSEHIPILERAKAWQKLKTAKNLSNSELAAILGISRMYVGQVLHLVGMPQAMVRALEDEKVTSTELADIRALPEEDQMDVFIEVMDRQQSREEIRRMIKDHRHKVISHLRIKHRPKDLYRRLGADNVHQNVVIASNHETMKHFVVKAMVYKLLRGMGRTTVCEMEAGGGVVDIYDAQTGYAYEIESKPRPDTGRIKAERFAGQVKDVLVIDLKKVPDDINGMEGYLKEKVV